MRPHSLPPGFEWKAELSRSDDRLVVRARQGERDWVVRLDRDSQRITGEMLLSRLTATGLVVPTEWGVTHDGWGYLVRPFVEGVPFATAVRDADESTWLNWVHELLQTLQALHRSGRVHRDVKSSNVIIGADGVRLVDLDLVGERWAAGAGSSLHIAPEVLLGHPFEPSADLFSLGVMLALAFGGHGAHPRFYERFPAFNFWDAAGLDPDLLPDALRPLVRALVRRSPSERPQDAAAAARFLESRHAPGPDPRLPFLAGREERLGRLAATVRRPDAVVLIGCEESTEIDRLGRELQLEIAARSGHKSVPARGILGEADVHVSGPSALLVSRGDLDADGAAALLLERAFSRNLEQRAFTWITSEAEASALAPRLVERIEGTGRSVVVETWPSIGVEALEAHLLSLSGGSSPDAARGLARTLLAQAGADHRELVRRLSQGEVDGAWRAVGDRIVLKSDVWPTDGAPVASAGKDIAISDSGWSPSGDVLRLARSLLVLGERGQGKAIAALARLSPERFAAAWTEAVDHELLDGVVGGEEFGGLPGLRRPWRDLIRRGLDSRARRRWHRRAIEVLRDQGVEELELADHFVAACEGDEDLTTLEGLAEAARQLGRFGQARRLAREILRRAKGPDSPHRERASVLAARLALDQGEPDLALSTLHEGYGDLEAAPHAVWLAATEAYELAGQRDLALELARRVIASRPARVHELQARSAIAYGAFLDGDLEGALAELDGQPRAGDALEPSVTAHAVRAGALSRMGRVDEALLELDRAAGLVARHGDVVLSARVDLNLAYTLRRAGRLSEAAARLESAREVFSRAGHLRLQAIASNNSGVLHADLGDSSRASEALEEAFMLRQRMGDRHGAASSQASRGFAALEAGRLPSAVALLEEAERDFRRGHHHRESRAVALRRSRALALLGRLEEAREAYLSELGDGEKDAASLCTLATLRFVEGERESAAAAAREAATDEGPAADLAEAFRASILWSALAPEDSDASQRLRFLADRLGSSIRRSEAQWRTRDRRHSPQRQVLEGWLATFAEGGRADLVRALSLELVKVSAHDTETRRRHSLGADQVVDGLVEGLEGAARKSCLERLLTLAAGSRTGKGGGLDVRWFVDCNRRMAAEQNLEGLLQAILDMTIEVTGAKRGFILLEEDEGLVVQFARGLDKHPMPGDQVHFSKTLVDSAIRSGEPILTTNAGGDPRFAEAESIRSFHLRSILCVPLPAGDGVRGALYLDDDQREAVFDRMDLERISILTDQAAIAIVSLRQRAEIEALSQRLRERVEVQEVELDRTRGLLSKLGQEPPAGLLVGDSPAMGQLLHQIRRVAPTSLAVLITGPSGSGKDVVARTIHHYSDRSTGPFVAENMAALPTELMESELFGHVRGSFTGALADRKGLFAEANGGTFLLDEIGEMPLELQVKLLRVLETGEFRPVGSKRSYSTDARIVAATHRDLAELVANGRFREDLYYRILGMEIRVPSLAERVTDIGLLARHFLAELNRQYDTDKRLSKELEVALMARPWPGEVRQLKNEVTRCYHFAAGDLDDPALLTGERTAPLAQGGSYRMDDAERAAIVRAMQAADQRKDQAAKLLGISRGGLYSKLKRLGLSST